MMMEEVLSSYGITEKNSGIRPFGTGLINTSWKITTEKGDFLLQQINDSVFKMPRDIMDNLALLTNHFSKNHPEYLFVAPLPSLKKKNFVRDRKNHVYRLFPFIKNSCSFDIVTDPQLAFEAAAQFGRFTRLLADFDPGRLLIPIRDFHNLRLRFDQFENSLQIAESKRKDESEEEIDFLQAGKGILRVYEDCIREKRLTVRVIHHDTKISNVLFDINSHKGLCVIDLDTVMPGYFISDLGDMFRTYLSPAAEDEPDLNKIEIREDYFREIVRGYSAEMLPVLSSGERRYFFYAGQFAIYMQALRFLADHLNGNRYYPVNYPNHNLVRARNQIDLLKKYQAKEPLFEKILKSIV